MGFAESNLPGILTYPGAIVLCTCVAVAGKEKIPEIPIIEEEGETSIEWVEPDSILRRDKPVDESSEYQLQKLEVKTQKLKRSRRIRLPEIEEVIGQTDDIANALLLEPGVGAVPESRSSLLVQGEGPHETRYHVLDVPMLSIAHFPGHSVVDHSGILINTVSGLDLYAGDFAGIHSGVSGAVVELQPGFAWKANPRLVYRPELVINVGNLDQDLSLYRRYENQEYQVGMKLADTFSTRLIKSAVHGRLGYIPPCSYQDFQITGEQRGERFSAREFGWIARDHYWLASLQSMPRLKVRSTEPWGVVGISLTDSTDERVGKMGFGAGRQYHYYGKQLGPIIPAKRVERQNILGTLEYSGIKAGSFEVDLRSNVEHVRWNGLAVVDRADSVPPRFVGMVDSLYRQPDYVARADEFITRISGSFHGAHANSRAALHMQGGVRLPYMTAFVDPGVEFGINKGSWLLHTNVGIGTSWPDLHGLPNTKYRKRQIRTYQWNTRTVFGNGRRLSLELRGYVKWKDHQPMEHHDPARPYWNPGSDVSLFSRGIGAQWTWVSRKYFRFVSIHDFSSSDTYDGFRFHTYPWEIPWKHQFVLGVPLARGRAHFFGNLHLSDGLSYHELAYDDISLFWKDGLKRVPNYHRLDLKLQWQEPAYKHRYVTQYDAYIEARNVLYLRDMAAVYVPGQPTWSNYREYYWNEHMGKRWVSVEPFAFNIGLRLGFRL